MNNQVLIHPNCLFNFIQLTDFIIAEIWVREYDDIPVEDYQGEVVVYMN